MKVLSWLGNENIPVDSPWNRLSDELRGPEVELIQVFAADNLATITPAGRDLEVQSSLLAATHHNDDDWFQGQVLDTNCSWWHKCSAPLCRNQSHGLIDISLDECTSWSLFEMWRWAVWVISPPQQASCGSGLWGALQLVSASTTWFLAEWTDSCWQARRQVVCRLFVKAQGNQTKGGHWWHTMF